MKPKTIEDFLRRPTYHEWVAELRDGWSGPDGSSCSLDNVEGIRIGITSQHYQHINLAANRHDWYYRLGRKHRLPRNFRRAADEAYRDMIIWLCAEHLIGFNMKMAKARAWARYYALRVGGWRAWRHAAKRTG